MNGKLPKKFRNNSGLYIVRNSKGYVACDYSDQANWLRYYGEPQKPSDLPEGFHSSDELSDSQDDFKTEFPTGSVEEPEITENSNDLEALKEEILA